MAVKNIKIKNFTAGDGWRFERTYTDLPTGITFTKVYLTIKEEFNDADPGEIQKFITGTLSSSGQITDASTSDGTIEFYIDVPHTDTENLTAEITYYYDLKGITSTVPYTFEIGQITPLWGVTDAST